MQTQTVAPAAPLNRREMIKQGLVGLLVAAVVLFVSSWFVDYRGLWNSLAGSFTRFDPANVAVDASAFKPYFTVKDRQRNKGPNFLVTLARTDAYPKTDADIDKLAAKATTLSARLALEALARGFVRVDYFGKDGKFIRSNMVRITELRNAPQTVLALPLPPDQPLTAVTLGF